MKLQRQFMVLHTVTHIYFVMDQPFKHRRRGEYGDFKWHDNVCCAGYGPTCTLPQAVDCPGVDAHRNPAARPPVQRLKERLHVTRRSFLRDHLISIFNHIPSLSPKFPFLDCPVLLHPLFLLYLPVFYYTWSPYLFAHLSNLNLLVYIYVLFLWRSHSVTDTVL